MQEVAMALTPNLVKESVNTLPVLPSLVDFRAKLIGLAASGKLRLALQTYRQAFFEGHLAHRDERARKVVLRGLWRAICEYEVGRFEHNLGGRSDILMDSAAIDEDTLLVAIQCCEIDAQVDRHSHISLGKCSFIMEMMCSSEGVVAERWIIYVEERLA